MENVRYLVREGGISTGTKAFNAALAALRPIERMPRLGSLRLGLVCEIPGLRSWGVKGFPLYWFYFEAADHLDVVRFLGDRQNIAAILIDEAPGRS